MKKTKPSLVKRSISYFLDLLIVMLLSGLISKVLIDTTVSDFQMQRQIDLTTKMASNEITSEQYNAWIGEASYDSTKASVPVTAITCIVTIIYYVVMSYYCKGITLGKYIMRLRIKSSNEKELSLGNYLLRSLVINMLLMNLTSIFLVSILSRQSFIASYSKVSNVFTIIMLLSLIVMMYREDGRGLHDLVSGTIVVDFKKDQEEVVDGVDEAKVVEEKR